MIDVPHFCAESGHELVATGEEGEAQMLLAAYFERRDDPEPVSAAGREALAEVRPASTMVVAGLVTPEMKVEVEVTAFRG